MRWPRPTRAGGLLIMPSLPRFAMDMNSRRIVLWRSKLPVARHPAVISLWWKRQATGRFSSEKLLFV